MKIQKAIEIIDLNINEAGSKMPQDVLIALKLSIEALQAVLRARCGVFIDTIGKLPSETEE